MSRSLPISLSWCAFALALATLASGCATGGRPARPDPRALPSPMPEEFPLPASKRSLEEPLSLGEARTLAIRRNPELAGLGWAVDAEFARIDQAAALPNPEFVVDVENLGGSKDNPMEATFLVGQRLELGGKRSRRVEVAESAVDVAEMDHALGFRDVTGRVTRDFVATLAAQHRIALFEELLAETREGVVTLEADPGGSRSHALDLARARVELDRTRLQRNRAAAALSAARVRLAAAWGGEARRPLRIQGELGTMAPPPSLDDLLASADRAPAVARWTKELQGRRAELAMERARRIPDVVVLAGYRRISGFDENTAVVSLGVPIPLFDRNRGNVEAAGDELVRARAQREVARLDLRTRLSIAYERLVSSYEAARELRESLVPSAQQAFDETRAAFHRGAVSFVALLEARRTAYRMRAEMLSAFTEYHQAVAEIEALVDLDVGPDF